MRCAQFAHAGTWTWPASFDIASATWKVYPLARYRSFTRDIEIDEDGAVYTSVSNFPAWQIEDAQPTLIRLRAAGAKLASP